MSLAESLIATSMQPVPNTANATWSHGHQAAVHEYSAQIQKLSIGMSLQGKIVSFSPGAQQAVKSGNIEAFRSELSEGGIVVDQNTTEGNLLDFVVLWLTHVLQTGNSATGQFCVSLATVARMGLYLISHGLVASPAATAKLDIPWLDLVPIPREDVETLGNFLATINQSQLPIRRVLRVFSFAVSHHGQLGDSEKFDAIIGHIDGRVDLEKVIENETQEAEERYWAKKNLFASGVEAVIVNALLRYEWEKRVNGLPLERHTLDFILQGPRTLLMRLFLLVANVPIATKLLSNLIKLCWPLPLLHEDFGDIMAMFALRHETLDSWGCIVESHRMASQYLHSDGLKNGFSGLIKDWGMIGNDVRNPHSKVYRLHWKSVGKSSSRRDFQDLLRPYVRASDSDELYAECKVFNEVDF